MNAAVNNTESRKVKASRITRYILNLGNWQTQSQRGLLDIVVLNLLRRGKCHGYKMVQVLKQSDALMMREGNIYSIIARLQTDGLVASHFEPSQGGPPRRYFELTELGEKTRAEMNTHWDQMIESIRTIRKGTDKEPRNARHGRV